jgi:hypothetical protein
MLQFTLDPEHQPDSATLRRLLEAHVVYERMASAKRVALHLLAIVSVVVWLGAMWPSLLPAKILDPALVIWAALLLIAVLAAVEERLWDRKVARFRDEQAQRKTLSNRV